MENYLQVLCQSPLFAGAAEADARAMLQCLGAVVRRYGRGEFVLRSGGPADQMGVVLSGGLQVCREDALGYRTILAALGPGELFGEAYACARTEALPVSVLASADSGAEQAFSEISQLQDSSNPYDPFALHKAALIACGIIPYREQISAEEVTKNLGSGLYLSTQVIHIPRGSGLGTSSILAGACVKAIYRMLGKELSQEELYNRVLCMEQSMSTSVCSYLLISDSIAAWEASSPPTPPAAWKVSSSCWV